MGDHGSDSLLELNVLHETAREESDDASSSSTQSSRQHLVLVDTADTAAVPDFGEAPPDIVPIQPFLHTNHIPTPTELAPIQAYTTHLTSIQTSLQSTLSTLQADLAKLEERHATLTTAAKPYASLRSAFWRFPPELLQVIFVACLPDTRGAVMHASEAPLLLARVCGRWRRIVENTPEMWSRVHVVPPALRLGVSRGAVDVQELQSQLREYGDFGEPVSGAEPSESVEGTTTPPPMGHAQITRMMNLLSFHRKRDVVAWWLARSGTCPLDISFVWIWGEGEDELRLCGLLLDVFFSVAHRWRRVEWQVPVKVFEFTGLRHQNDGLTMKCSDMRPQHVRMLRHFGIVDNRSTFSEAGMVPWPECLRFLQSTEDSENEEAERVELHSLSLTFFSGCVRLPSVRWDVMRELYLESSVGFFWLGEDPEMWDTLEECVALESLTLKFPLSSMGGTIGNFQNDGDVLGLGDNEGSGSKRRVTTLPRLERLCVDGDQSLAGAFHVTRTLAGMRCPSLKGLEVYGRNTAPTPEVPDHEDEDEDQGDGEPASPTPVQPGFAVDSEAVGEIPEKDEDGNLVPLPLNCAEPLHGIFHLLHQSQHPPLERLTLESVTLLAPELVKCLVLVSPTLRELVVRDYAWRSFANVRLSRSSMLGKKGKGAQGLSPEDVVLKILVAGPATLCPKLVLFDASLSSLASQSLFCEFVESRYLDPPEGTERLKVVRCAFTAKEEVGMDVGGGVQKRMEKLSQKGRKGAGEVWGGMFVDEDEEDGEQEGGHPPLDVSVTFHLPMSEEIVPSAWTGIEGL